MDDKSAKIIEVRFARTGLVSAGGTARLLESSRRNHAEKEQNEENPERGLDLRTDCSCRTRFIFAMLAELK